MGGMDLRKCLLPVFLYRPELSDRQISESMNVPRHTISRFRKAYEVEGVIPVRSKLFRRRGMQLLEGESRSKNYPGHFLMADGRYRQAKVSAGGFYVNIYKVEKTCAQCGKSKLLTFNKLHNKRNPAEWTCSKTCFGRFHTGRKRTRSNHGKKDYVFVFHPEHHRADATGMVREHVLVAEKMLGRKILKSEDVHHIDCDSLNNAPENLHVFKNGSEHHLSHGTINKCIKELLAIGVVVFDRESGSYRVVK
jgi:hypothetical protein